MQDGGSPVEGSPMESGDSRQESVDSLRKTLEEERKSRAEMEKTLKADLEEEINRRTKLEEACQSSSMMVSVLSPLEKMGLSYVAKLMSAIRLPSPRCFCCFGPCFWFIFVPFLLLRVSTLQKRTVEKAVDESGLPASLSYQNSKRPAAKFRAQGRTKNHPVVMIPGMTSTALEVWKGFGCYEDLTRQRVWSSRLSTQTFFLDPECLQKHLCLDEEWNDPEGVRVRAASGLAAADAFGPLNLWGELIQNLAMLGYDESSLALLGYDWRMDPVRLESRDSYFTRLRRTVELLVETNNGRRVILVGHSLGGNHAFYFFGWVEAKRPGWVEKHVESLTTIGGAFLGAIKTYPYLISGEMTDTVQMGQMFAIINELHGGLSRDSIENLTRSWGSVAGLLPKGGNLVWGNKTMTEISYSDEIESFDADQTFELLRAIAPNYTDLVESTYDISALPPIKKKAGEYQSWSNPLLVPLPRAPTTKIHCLYGTGRPTPIAIRYAKTTPAPNGNVKFKDKYEILKNGQGMMVGDGDGTVPLLSLGYMCAEGWASSKLNPARMRVITKEYKHEELPISEAMTRPLELIQGLANEKDADHITILGNREVIADILDIALGGDSVDLNESLIESDLCTLADETVDKVLKKNFVHDGAADACVNVRKKAREAEAARERTKSTAVEVGPDGIAEEASR